MPSTPGRSLAGLPLALAVLEQRYRTPEALAMDPLAIVLGFTQAEDQELAAWVAAHLAYGRVAPMLRAIKGVLQPLGAKPAEILRNTPEARLRSRLRKALEAWVWRFHTREDLIEWLLAWKHLDAESGGRGLEYHLQPQPGLNAEARLSALVLRLRRDLPVTHGIRFLLPDPESGSACKRWRLFLRWMVRRGWPDLGLWRQYPVADLMMPVDTHVARITRYLGFSTRRTPDGAMAREITAFLRTIDPEDPLRFDFALAHMGILGDCPERFRAASCAQCPMSQSCGRPEWLHKISE
jgi:uncharacterized protein (TIGR02757 family)